MNLLDCQLLGGSGLLAGKAEGFTLMGRRSYGFGDSVVAANADLLGGLKIEKADPHNGPEKWGAPRRGVDVLAACPPCSGFSQLNFRGRGIHAAAHLFTWDLIKFAAKCNSGRGPTTVVFECVQSAGREGLPLMLEYFNYLCSETKSKYNLTHVFMSGASVGSASERKRYFWVASKLPFRVNCEAGRSPVTVGDRLSGEVTPERSEGWPHWDVLNSQTMKSEILEMVVETHVLGGWKPGATLQQVAMELARKRKLPRHLKQRYFDSHNCWVGFPGPKILDPGLPAPVFTGGSAADFLHPYEHRFVTVYEAGRLLGYSPEWQWPGESVRKTFELIGKGVPVESWAWILRNIKNSLEGNLGSLRGQVVDVTYAHQGDHKIKTYE
jgi:site-specific DNA-cytosine methylase